MPYGECEFLVPLGLLVRALKMSTYTFFCMKRNIIVVFLSTCPCNIWPGDHRDGLASARSAICRNRNRIRVQCSYARKCLESSEIQLVELLFLHLTKSPAQKIAHVYGQGDPPHKCMGETRHASTDKRRSLLHGSIGPVKKMDNGEPEKVNTPRQNKNKH